MINEYNIYWVEDETEDSLAELRSYLESSLHFNLSIGTSYQEAEDEIRHNDSFDIIIIDIRIPKGKVSEKNQSRLSQSPSVHHNQFGFELIEFIYNEKKQYLDKIIIYTNESWENMQERLNDFNIRQESSYIQKSEYRSNKDFETKILAKILNNG
jgi:DNA-binding NarL/FixJ family response regulator